LSYWQGNTVADDWELRTLVTLIEAEKRDMFYPLILNRNGFRTNREAKQWRFTPQYGNDLACLSFIYTGFSGSSRFVCDELRETANISNESKLRLAAAYALAGQKQLVFLYC
jgi:hypothetical protein